MTNVKLTVAVVIAVVIVASIGSAAVLLNKDDDGRYHSNDNIGRQKTESDSLAHVRIIPTTTPAASRYTGMRQGTTTSTKTT